MPSSKAVVLWDESFLWGLIALRTLRQKGLIFDLIRAEDLRKGALEGRSLLFVPGGWASNKLKALGNEGADTIRRFVQAGGTYLGFCGGAGLATQDGLGLLAVERVPTEHRVPSFSGPITCMVNDHPMWDNIYRPVFHAWWPSQFRITGTAVEVLARYGKAQPDAYSSDIRVGSVTSDDEWAARETAYGINLNPKRIAGEPAVIEGRYKKGRVLLSLLHFDTPDDARGNRVMRRLWTELGGQSRTGDPETAPPKGLSPHAEALVKEARALISTGEELALWRWRTPWVLQWKRGVRGLEYCTLANMAAAVAEQAYHRFGEDIPEAAMEQLLQSAQKLAAFRQKAEELLRLEHTALTSGSLAYDRCDNPAVRSLRTELFGTAKRYGGTFKIVLDSIDTQLFAFLKQ